MAKTVSEQTKITQVNGFTGGINTDLHPMLQPNDTLTDCLNGTLITYNGNENMLQNDMGNYELKNAKLPDGYIPMGMREYQGVLYLILMNPLTHRVQVGSYPSPRTDFQKAHETEEYDIHPVEIGTMDEFVTMLYTIYNDDKNSNIVWKYNNAEVEKENLDSIKCFVDNNISEAVWRLLENYNYYPDACKFLYSELDRTLSTTVFTKDFEDHSMLTLGDQYKFSQTLNKENGENSSDKLAEKLDNKYELNPPYQQLKFFTVNNEKELHDVNKDDVYFMEDDVFEQESSEFNNVAWESNGWLGAKFEVEAAKEINQNIGGIIHGQTGIPTITKFRKTTSFPADFSEEVDLTYEFKLENIDLSNKIVDFEQYVEDNKNNLVFVQGMPENLDVRTFTFIEELDEFTGIEFDEDIDFKNIAFKNEYTDGKLVYSLQHLVVDKVSSTTVDLLKNIKKTASTNTIAVKNLYIVGSVDCKQLYECLVWENTAPIYVENVYILDGVTLVNKSSGVDITKGNIYIPNKDSAKYTGVFKCTIKNYDSESLEDLYKTVGDKKCKLIFDKKLEHIGLSGTWKDNVYTPADTDYLGSLHALVNNVKGSHNNNVVIFPQKFIGADGNVDTCLIPEGGTYILADREDKYSILFYDKGESEDDEILGHGYIYTNTEVEKIGVEDYPPSIINVVIKPLWKFQHENISLKIDSEIEDIKENTTVKHVKLEPDGDNAKLTVKVNSYLPSKIEEYKKYYDDVGFYGEPVNNSIIYCTGEYGHRDTIFPCKDETCVRRYGDNVGLIYDFFPNRENFGIKDQRPYIAQMMIPPGYKSLTLNNFTSLKKLHTCHEGGDGDCTTLSLTDCGFTTLTVPISVTKLTLKNMRYLKTLVCPLISKDNLSITNCPELKNIVFVSPNKGYTTFDGIDLSKKAGYELSNIVLPGCIDTITGDAFNGINCKVVIDNNKPNGMDVTDIACEEPTCNLCENLTITWSDINAYSYNWEGTFIKYYWRYAEKLKPFTFSYENVEGDYDVELLNTHTIEYKKLINSGEGEEGNYTQESTKLLGYQKGNVVTYLIPYILKDGESFCWNTIPKLSECLHFYYDVGDYTLYDGSPEEVHFHEHVNIIKSDGCGINNLYIYDSNSTFTGFQGSGLSGTVSQVHFPFGVYYLSSTVDIKECSDDFYKLANSMVSEWTDLNKSPGLDELGQSGVYFDLIDSKNILYVVDNCALKDNGDHKYIIGNSDDCYRHTTTNLNDCGYSWFNDIKNKKDYYIHAFRPLKDSSGKRYDIKTVWVGSDEDPGDNSGAWIYIFSDSYAEADNISRKTLILPENVSEIYGYIPHFENVQVKNLSWLLVNRWVSTYDSSIGIDSKCSINGKLLSEYDVYLNGAVVNTLEGPSLNTLVINNPISIDASSFLGFKGDICIISSENIISTKVSSDNDSKVDWSNADLYIYCTSPYKTGKTAIDLSYIKTNNLYIESTHPCFKIDLPTITSGNHNDGIFMYAAANTKINVTSTIYALVVYESYSSPQDYEVTFSAGVYSNWYVSTGTPDKGYSTRNNIMPDWFHGSSDKKYLSYRESAAYEYLFSGMSFTMRDYSKIWYKNNEAIGNEKIFYIRPLQFDSKINDKYVVPENFGFQLSEGENILKDNKKGTELEDFCVNVGEIPIGDVEVPAFLNINVDNPELLKIATKCEFKTANDLNTEYYDLSSGTYSINYKTSQITPAEVKISSVPYKTKTVNGKEYLLIYNTHTKEDTLNYKENYSLSITGFNYYIDENSQIHVSIEVNGVMNYSDVSKSLELYRVDREVFILCNSECSIEESSGNVGDKVSLTIMSDIDLLSNKFVFINVQLDSDDKVLLPIYTGMTSDKKALLLNQGYSNFAELYIDDLDDLSNKTIPEDCMEYTYSSDQYLTAKKVDNEWQIVCESPYEYYWYNGILKDSNIITDESDKGITKEYYYGKGDHLQAKINLTSLGIGEGDIIGIDGVVGKDYEGITVTVKNKDLFEKLNGNIYLKIDTLGRYTLQKHTVTLGKIGDPLIYKRRYLIHHGTPPITHSERDLEWDNSLIGTHAGWNGDKGLESKQLYVTKSDACNPNVQVSVVTPTPESYDGNSFRRGATMTNYSQVCYEVEKMTGDSKETKQLFSLVRAELDVNKCGFIIPVPRMPMGIDYKLQWTENKHNKGTYNGIVLTRASNGHQWKNQMKNAIAYTGIVGGIAAVATCVVMGCIAAFGASAGVIAGVATLAAASAAIPFVGWAVLAAAVVAASIYLLVKVFTGEDQEFEFYVVKGPSNQRLLIPLWGTHDGKGRKQTTKWQRLNLIPGGSLSASGAHPWYFDPNFTYAEELITFIYTHIYYREPLLGVGLSIKNDKVSELERNSFSLDIKPLTSSTTMFGIDEYLNIANLVYPTHNFEVKDPRKGAKFSYTSPNAGGIKNNFNVTGQKLDTSENISNDAGVYHYDEPIIPEYIVGSARSEWWHSKEDINDEIATFIGYLGGDGKNVYYNGPRKTEDQSAFGGNSGGRSCKFKCMTEKGSKAKMIDGEYPVNNEGYVPVAYGVDTYSKDKIMLKDIGWGYGNSWWGTSKTPYFTGPESIAYGSKYYDFIRFSSFSEEFKLTCNTNEI